MTRLIAFNKRLEDSRQKMSQHYFVYFLPSLLVAAKDASRFGSV
jgi:hypothetical protein